MVENIGSGDFLICNLEVLDTIDKQRTAYFFSKKVFDLVASVIALVLLSPLLLIVMILIPLDSPGSAFFTQNRVGVRRKRRGDSVYWEKVIFPCYKFRTMTSNADPSIHREYIKALIDHDGEKIAAIQGAEIPTKKIVRDKRITRLGRILRKTSIDELPQLINVLKGEMSIVGPRPAIPYEVEMYKPWYFRRLDALPGLTGLWQVKARSEVGFEEMVEYDIEYVENQSFWLDIKILMLTPIVVLSTKGAH